MTERENLTPKEIVAQLNKYIIGQDGAKKSVAVALRNRWRRKKLSAELQKEIIPKNILLIGPTGVGKTEIARRLADLTGAPFVKVEATKYTEVGYVGRDVEQMIRDLLTNAIRMVQERESRRFEEKAEAEANNRILQVFWPKKETVKEAVTDPVSFLFGNSEGEEETKESAVPSETTGMSERRRQMAERIASGQWDDREIEVEVSEADRAVQGILTGNSTEELTNNFQEMLGNLVPKKKKKKKKVYNGKRIQDFAELSIGDLVVHEKHGLGIYRGIEKVEVDRVVKDYIKIEYRGGSNLYILATQLDALQKYSGSSENAKTPKLNKLGGQEWNKTKSRVKGAVKNIAKELVELYAVRQEKEGYVCGPDTVWQKEFEEMFPYEETEDQLAAIEDTKKDMESTKIMDRLVCGDVGYGKTEVALRAAFKAVQESRQVVYLVPTTILAQQHYNTFVQRMKEFPVKVELLCRFRTSAQQKKTIEGIKKGQVDIVIGTHRVLSKDVEFKNLGLLIIDEEQRFGVTHKEKIKQMKKDVDVLTLTATPIPRTLHMSLIGIRDMSVLEEPPMDRVPIQTYVMEYDEETVREAIRRELRRGGQVYYVYNRVNDIAEVALRISRLVPEARVDFAHGQMSQRELEQVMYDFINGDVDVLVSTTIIETGLDISNVNTMIIHDSDRYGLSQLYQLRGRVGRSNRTAYAFLMYTKNKMLQETAEKRLSAMREYSDLGSGFKIAMKDLELRGAGNLLGAQQHGHMNAVGYDLYCKMLSEAVKEAKGIRTMDDFETTIDLNIDAFIPDSYIGNEFQKLDIYKRIAGIESQQEYDDMLEELIDRFGEPTKAVLNLLAIARLKALAHQGYVTEIKQLGKDVRITLYEKAKLDPAGIPAIMAQYRRGLQFKADHEPKFILTPQGRLIEELMKFAGELAKLAEPLE
mgnify:CR=1 FL=1